MISNRKALIDWYNANVRSRRTVFLILLIYLVLVFLYYYYFLYSTQWYCTKEFLEKIEPGFAVSFSASLMEDLLVFIALSIFVIILTTKPIYSYSYAEKISAIINSEHAKGSEGVNLFVQHTINNILGYTKAFDIELTITDYDISETAYKIYVEQTYEVANICNDKDFYLEKYGDFTVATFDAVVDNYHGEVTLFDIATDGKTPIPFVDPKFPYILKKPFKKEGIDLGLRKDQVKKVRLFYNGWSKTCSPDDRFKKDIWNEYTSNRFAEAVSIQIHNRFSKPLRFEVYSHKNRLKLNNGLTLCNAGVIMPNMKLDSLVELNGEIHPGDDVRVYFYPQE